MIIESEKNKPRYCKKCGKEVDEGNVFCTSCGIPIDENTERIDYDRFNPNEPPTLQLQSQSYSTNQLLQNAPKKSPRNYTTVIAALAVFGVVAVAIVVITMFSWVIPKNIYVNIVKSGTFNSYPEQTVGKAFGTFFDSPEWSGLQR